MTEYTQLVTIKKKDIKITIWLHQPYGACLYDQLMTQVGKDEKWLKVTHLNSNIRRHVARTVKPLQVLVIKHELRMRTQLNQGTQRWHLIPYPLSDGFASLRSIDWKICSWIRMVSRICLHKYPNPNELIYNAKYIRACLECLCWSLFSFMLCMRMIHT